MARAAWRSGGDRLVELTVKATPRARRPGAGGLVEAEPGRMALKVSVAEPACDGAANRAVIAALARELGLPPSALRIVAGQGSRLKRVAIEGDEGRIAAALARLAQSET